MTVDSLQTLIVVLLGAAGTGIGVIGRWASASGKALRLKRAQLDAAEPYIFDLRRQLRASGQLPAPWPERLEYLASTLDESGGRSDDPR
jgi:hypothetical protein